MRQALGITAGSGGLLSTLLAAGWTGVVLLGAVILTVVISICWVIADPERPKRLALLITATRGGRSPRRPAQRPALDKPPAPRQKTGADNA